MHSPPCVSALGADNYAITQNDAEIERQVRYASAWDAEARYGLSIINVGRGWKAIDVGCGPIGILLTLAELVGPDGAVMGLDMHVPSLRRARSILDEHELHWVELVQANVNELDVACVSPTWPFDVAFCRNMLTHQRDAAHALRRIASIVRPGGFIVAHNQLGDPLPQSDPPVPALDRFTEWVIPVFAERGSRWVARRHPELCDAAGLRLVSQRCFFRVGADCREITERRESLASWRSAVVQSGVASDADIDGALRQLAEAEGWQFQAVFSGLYAELIAQVL
jgi:ubiquinone/menaquinone biosynthesis C-methylase UbiE